MFLVNAIKRWFGAVEAIYRDMEKLETEACYIGDDLRVVPRVSFIKLVAPIPPLARYLVRKLISNTGARK